MKLRWFEGDKEQVRVVQVQKCKNCDNTTWKVYWSKSEFPYLECTRCLTLHH